MTSFRDAICHLLSVGPRCRGEEPNLTSPPAHGNRWETGGYGSTGGWTAPPITSFVVRTTTPSASWSQSNKAVNVVGLIE
jgi:hypothetical protein